MAINFPSSPADGKEYTDANSGTWVYDKSSNSWSLKAAGNTSPFDYRGGWDFASGTAPTGLKSGDLWTHEGADGATINGVYTGMSGTIAAGQMVLYDGSKYVKVGSTPGYPNTGDGEGATLDDRYLKLKGRASQTVEGSITAGGAVQCERPSGSTADGFAVKAGTKKRFGVDASGSLKLSDDIANDTTVKIELKGSDGSIEAAGNIKTGAGVKTTGAAGAQVNADGLIASSRTTGKSSSTEAFYVQVAADDKTAKEKVIEMFTDGTIVARGDVAVGDSSKTFRTIAAVIAALPEDVRTKFADALAAWESAGTLDLEDPTTLPADNELKEAIVRATTKGTINLNANTGQVDCKSTFVNEYGRLNVYGKNPGNYFGWSKKNTLPEDLTTAEQEADLASITDFTYPQSSKGIMLGSSARIGFAVGQESPVYGSGVQMLFTGSKLGLGGYRSYDCYSTVDIGTDKATMIELDAINGRIKTAGSIYSSTDGDADKKNTYISPNYIGAFNGTDTIFTVDADNGNLVTKGSCQVGTNDITIDAVKTRSKTQIDPGGYKVSGKLVSPNVANYLPVGYDPDKLTFANYFGTGIDTTFSVTAGGSIAAAGTISASGKNTVNETSALKLSQETNAKSQIRAYGPDDSTTGSLEFKVSPTSGTALTPLTLNSDGSATFDGSITTKSRSFFPDIVCGSKDYKGPYAFIGSTEIALNLNSSTPAFKVTNNGNATLAGSVEMQSTGAGYIGFIAYDPGGGNYSISPSNDGAVYKAGLINLGSGDARWRDVYGTSARMGNVYIETELDDPKAWNVTEETYTETEYIEVPVVDNPGTGTADIEDGVSTADLTDKPQTQTVAREVEKTREVKTYVGHTMDVKDTLLKLTAALTGLKTAAASASTCDELKAAINTALADI